MEKGRFALALALLAAAHMAFAEEPSKPREEASPKHEQPATAAGGQSSGPSAAPSGGFEIRGEALAMGVGAIVAVVVAASVSSTTSH